MSCSSVRAQTALAVAVALAFALLSFRHTVTNAGRKAEELTDVSQYFAPSLVTRYIAAGVS